MSSEPDTDETDPQEYGISNDELVTQERLRQILSWHDRVLEKEDEIEFWVAKGKMPAEKADELLKSTVTSYIRALSTLISQRDDGQKWLEQYRLGTIVFEAPNPYELAWREEYDPARIGQDIPKNPTSLPDNYRLAEDSDSLESESLEINGLANYARLPCRIEREYTVKLDYVYDSKPVVAKMSKSKPVPRQITTRAFEVAAYLAEDMGLDVDINDLSSSFNL